MVTAAAVYCRISRDTAGERLGVQRQEKLCRELAESKGWPVAEVYVDNSVSASNGDHRAAYQAMVADLEAGRRDAVVCVDLDRLTRRPVELEGFMAVADEHGVALANVGGDTDLSSSDGRLRARILGAVAAQESERKAERIRRQKAQHARQGKPNGGPRPYGYESDGMTVVADEAELIREAAELVLAGRSVRSIATAWNDAGHTTSQGNRWRTQTLLRLLRGPRIAGLRQHKGEIVGEAAWEPIIDRDTHERLVAKLTPKRRPGRPATYLLSGIAVCGRCGNTLFHGSRDRYRCYAGPGRAPDACGGLTVSQVPADALIRDAIIEALSGDGLAEARAALADDSRQAEAAATLADVEDRSEELATMFADGTLTRREWLAARERLDARADAARRVLAREARAGALASVDSDSDALRDTWERRDTDWRRALVEAVVESITVHPAAKPGGPFDPDRIELIWRA